MVVRAHQASHLGGPVQLEMRELARLNCDVRHTEAANDIGSHTCAAGLERSPILHDSFASPARHYVLGGLVVRHAHCPLPRQRDLTGAASWARNAPGRGANKAVPNRENMMTPVPTPPHYQQLVRSVEDPGLPLPLPPLNTPAEALRRPVALAPR